MELVLLSDELTQCGYVVSLCYTRLSVSVCEFLIVLWFPDVDRKWLRPLGGGANRKWCQIRFLDHSFVQVACWHFYLSPSVKKLFNMFVFAYNNLMGWHFGGFVVLWTPWCMRPSVKLQKGTNLLQIVSFESSCMSVRRSVRSACDCEKKNY